MADNIKIYRIQDSQSGKIYEIEGPEGATDEELYSFLEQDLSANPPAEVAPQPKKPSVAPRPLTNIQQYGLDEVPQGKLAISDDVAAAMSDIEKELFRIGTQTQDDPMGAAANVRNRLPFDPNVKDEDIAYYINQYRQGQTTPINWVAKKPEASKPGDTVISAAPVLSYDERLLKRVEEMASAAGDGLNAAFIRGGGALLRSDAQDEQDNRAILEERARRAMFWEDQDRRSDSPVLDTIADFGGMAVGDINPLYFVNPELGMGAVGRVLGQAGIGAGLDSAVQLSEVSQGLREKFDPNRAIIAGAANAAVSGVVEGLGGYNNRFGKTEIKAAAEGRSPVETDSRTANLDTYLKTQLLPPKTGEMRARNEAQRKIRGDAVKEANDFVNETTKDWTNKPDIEAVPSWVAIKDKTIRDGLDPNAVAAIVDGKVYINLKNVNDPSDITAAIFHEGLGHHGLAQRFSNDLDAFLENIYDNGTSSFTKKVDQWKVDNPDVYKDLDLPTQHRRAIEEVLAEMSEGGALPVTIRDKVSNFLKEWARSMGINLKVSEREIRSILAMAHQNVIKGDAGNVSLNGVRYMYAGRNAQLSDEGFDSLLTAAEADRRVPGVPTREKLGWFKGPDGEWRIEFDDSKAAPKALDPDLSAKLSEDYDVPTWQIDGFSVTNMMDNMANEDFANTIGTKIVDLEDVIDHPMLFEAYPELKGINFTRSKTRNYLGQYDPNTKTIDVSVYNDNPMSTALHEVQHAIQDIEGWSFGGINAPYVLSHMDRTKLVDGAIRYIDFLKGTQEQLRINAEESRMIYEDPSVIEWFALKQKNNELGQIRNAMRDDLTDRGIDPINDPEYRQIMRQHGDAFRKYYKFDDTFAERNGLDPKNLSEEEKSFIRTVKYDYVSAPDRGLSRVLRAEESLSDLTQKIRDLEFITKEVDPRSNLSKTIPPAMARRDLERILARDDTVLYEAYQHLLGEVEARDVQRRQMLTDEERLATEPYSLEGHIDPENYIFIRPGRAAPEVVPIHKRVEEIVNDEAEFWGIKNIEKALTERDFRADVRARLAQMGLPQDSINLDRRIAKNIDVRYSMKRRVPRERDEAAEISAAKDILEGILAGHVPIERSWGEAEADARRAGLTAKQIKKAGSVGELDKRLFQYERVAQALNEKLANLHAKMDSGGFSMATKQKYLETLAEFNELNGLIFKDQGEIGRALNAVKALQFTKKKLSMLNEALGQMQGNGFKNFADDEAFKAFAERVQFMMNSNNPQGVANLAKSVLKPYWWQYGLSFRHSMMLSGLGTHAKNATDNALMIARELEEAAIAAPGFVIRKGLQKSGFNVKDGVSPQEFAGRLYGLLRAGLDATTYKEAVEAFKTGRGNTVYSSKTEVADARIPVVSHVQDALHAADVFFRAFHNNANLYSAGIRRARAEGYRGVDAFEEGSNLATTPDEALIKEARDMTDVALLVDRPSLLSNKLEGLKAIRPGMKGGEQALAFTANLMFPFFRVTDRLLFQKIRRSPLGLLDRVTREDLRAGGARMDIALGRMAYGSLLMYYYWNEAGKGNVTGSQLDDYDKQLALEAGGYMSNSVKEGNQYVDASALNLSLLPQDLQNSVAANIATIRRAYDEGASADDTAEALKLSSMALLKVLSSQSFAENLSQYVDPVKANNEATSDSAIGNVVGGFVSSFVPAAMRQYNAMFHDPIKRDTVGDKSVTDRIMGRVKSGIPGLSDDLPAKISVYGDEQPQGRSLLSMDNYRDIKTDSVSTELQRLEKTTKSAVVVGAPSSFEDEGNKYKLNAAERNEWNIRQGAYLKDFVKELISGPDWKALSDAEKIEEIKAARKDAYEWAKEDMLPKLRPSND